MEVRQCCTSIYFNTMKYKMQYIVVFLLFQFLSSFSQVTDIVWQQCFVTENHSTDSYCIERFNNGYLVGIEVCEGGVGVSNYHGSSDAWYIYIDTIGNIIWERCYGGTSGEYPTKIIPIDEQYYYLVNISCSTDGDVMCENNGEADVWVVKIDTAGSIIWQNCYGGPDTERPRDAILTPDGGLLFMSRIYDGGGDISNFYGLYDNWICKIDSVGNIEWETTIGSIGRDNGFRLLLTEGNTYLALCSVADNGGMSECEIIGQPGWDTDLWLVELDMEGNILSQDCYGGSTWDLGIDIIETKDGYVILSNTESNDFDVSGNHGEWDFWLLKLNKDHRILWQRCLGGSSYDSPNYLTQTDDNGYMLIGSTHSNNGDVSGNHSPPPYSNSDVWVVKTDSVGEPVWQHCFGSVKGDWFWGTHTVVKKSDYDFVLAPITNGGGDDVECQHGESLERNWIFEIKDCSQYPTAIPQKPTGKNHLCVNTDSITTYTTQMANGAWAYEWELSPDGAGTITQDSIATQIHWSPTYEDTATIKVRSINDCGESAWSDSLVVNTYMCLGSEEYDDKNLISVYPNPAKTKLFVQCNKLNDGSSATVEMFDRFGRLTSTFQVGKDLLGCIDVANLGKGLYFVRVVVNGKIVGVRKVVVE